MTSRHVLIVGATRGIGLELARQSLAAGHRVTATCRGDRGGLDALEGVTVLDGIDLAKPETLAVLTEGAPVDDLIINGGIYPKEGSFGAFESDTFIDGFKVNALGPLLAAQAVHARLHEGSRVLFVSTRMASISDNSSGGSYAYRMSKVALNMGARSLAIELKQRQIAVGLVHPGFVRTSMTANNGLINADESASGILARLNELTLENAGSFWHMNGELLPW